MQWSRAILILGRCEGAVLNEEPCKIHISTR